MVRRMLTLLFAAASTQRVTAQRVIDYKLVSNNGSIFFSRLLRPSFFHHSETSCMYLSENTFSGASMIFKSKSLQICLILFGLKGHKLEEVKELKALLFATLHPTIDI